MTAGNTDTFGISDNAQDRHKRPARMLGYALTLDDPKVWGSMPIVWHAHLNSSERYQLARSTVLALRRDEIKQLFEDIMGGAGYPLPSFLDPLDDARLWADLANAAELQAYCFAAFMALPRSEKLDFIAFAKGKVT